MGSGASKKNDDAGSKPRSLPGSAVPPKAPRTLGVQPPERPSQSAQEQRTVERTDRRVSVVSSREKANGTLETRNGGVTAVTGENGHVVRPKSARRNKR